MRIEIFSIGNELLSGRVVNTNAAFIGEKLESIGLSVARETALPDEPNVVKSALDEALKRCDLILMTGGLGPTSDDRTRAILVDYFAAPLELNQDVLHDLEERFGKNHVAIKDQALIPKGVIPIINKVGTAPGLRFEKVIALPGVPSEMSVMIEDDILPLLKGKGEKCAVREIKLMQIAESLAAPFFEDLEKEHPHVLFGSYPGFGCVAIRFKGDEEEVNLIEKKWQKAFPKQFFVAPSAVHILQETMVKRGLTLSLAESCTGGAIATHITALSGASDYFLGSIVSYSNEMKGEALHVKKETLKSYGAVSCQVAEEMALGALKVSGADYAVSVTGIAGPLGGTAEKPIGTVYAAIAEKGKIVMSGLVPCRHKKTRATIVAYTAAYMIGALWKWIEHRDKSL